MPFYVQKVKGQDDHQALQSSETKYTVTDGWIVIPSSKLVTMLYPQSTTYQELAQLKPLILKVVE